MKTARSAILLLFCLCLPASAGAAEGADQLAQSQNAFAFDLYAQLREKPGNLFFSPHSVATAMTMTFSGAKGDTAAEMAKALHLEGISQKQILDDYAGQSQQLNKTEKDGMELHVANALWGKDKYPFDPAYVKSIKDSFNGALEPVDFNNEPAARKKINDWVSDRTKGKIPQLFGPGILNPATRLVLTNAVYFKAAWLWPFDKRLTGKMNFHVAAGKDVKVDMMNQMKHHTLAELDGFKLLTLPYKYGEASMLILLPDAMDGLADLEKSITAEKLAAWEEKNKSVRVALSLPKFKDTSQFTLNDVLKDMGMKKAFAPGQADFTGIADVPGEPLNIDTVVHKAFVDVNEESTEAAAATGVAMGVGSARPEDPVPFVADHPFLYLIRHNRTGAILFMGRLAEPAMASEEKKWWLF